MLDLSELMARPAARGKPAAERLVGVKPPEPFLLDRLPTPIGMALLVSDADGFCARSIGKITRGASSSCCGCSMAR
jgi:hypothetical protein